MKYLDAYYAAKKAVRDLPIGGNVKLNDILWIECDPHSAGILVHFRTWGWGHWECVSCTYGSTVVALVERLLDITHEAARIVVAVLDEVKGALEGHYTAKEVGDGPICQGGQ